MHHQHPPRAGASFSRTLCSQSPAIFVPLEASFSPEITRMIYQNSEESRPNLPLPFQKEILNIFKYRGCWTRWGVEEQAFPRFNFLGNRIGHKSRVLILVRKGNFTCHWTCTDLSSSPVAYCCTLEATRFARWMHLRPSIEDLVWKTRSRSLAGFSPKKKERKRERERREERKKKREGGSNSRARVRVRPFHREFYSYRRTS